MEYLADNLTFLIQEDVLCLQIDLNDKGYESKSGLSRVIASTRGNIALPGMPDVKLGLNLYKVIPGAKRRKREEE